MRRTDKNSTPRAEIHNTTPISQGVCRRAARRSASTVTTRRAARQSASTLTTDTRPTIRSCPIAAPRLPWQREGLTLVPSHLPPLASNTTATPTHNNSTIPSLSRTSSRCSRRCRRPRATGARASQHSSRWRATTAPTVRDISDSCREYLAKVRCKWILCFVFGCVVHFSYSHCHE